MTCELLIDKISDAYGSNSAIFWFAGSREAALAAGRPECDLERGDGRSEKQVGLSLCVCGLMLLFFILAKHTVLSLLAHGFYWYQAAESNAFASLRR